MTNESNDREIPVSHQIPTPDPDALRETVSVETFFACDIRVGTITACELNPKARKPSYRLTIDFGGLGTLASSAQLTRIYTDFELVGRQIVAVVNFPPRNVAGVVSRCLVLGVETEEGVVLLQPERGVADGMRIS